MADLPAGWVQSDGPPSSPEVAGSTFRAQKWFGDHYKEVVTATLSGLEEAINGIEAEVAGRLLGAEQRLKAEVDDLLAKAEALTAPLVEPGSNASNAGETEISSDPVTVPADHESLEERTAIATANAAETSGGESADGADAAGDEETTGLSQQEPPAEPVAEVTADPAPEQEGDTSATAAA